MSNRKFLFIIVVACLVTGAVSFFSTLYFFNNKSKEIVMEENKAALEEPILKTAQKQKENKTIENEPQKDKIEEETEVVETSTEARITPSTKMVYQYYYPQDDVMEQQEDVPPYFLLDLTFEDMQKLYDNWQVVSFSEKEVILRKTMEGESDQRYIVGEQDGYIAVFYQKEQNGISLHEVTNTPISSLSEEEVQRLENGIFVTGDIELSKILEDYGS